MYLEFPKWVYSETDSRVVASAAELETLPLGAWYAAPTMEGEPYFVRRPVEREPTEAEIRVAAALNRDSQDFGKIDKRSKEYRDSQVPQ